MIDVGGFEEWTLTTEGATCCGAADEELAPRAGDFSEDEEDGTAIGDALKGSLILRLPPNPLHSSLLLALQVSLMRCDEDEMRMMMISLLLTPEQKQKRFSQNKVL